ncbi:hypothetical protein MferCBS31731_002170 [Microsporum ferrugineum]
MAPVGSFEHLQSVGDNIYLFEPPGSASTTLVTLCTWLGGATPRRIQKYIDGYRVLYPNSRILLITTYILEITILPFSVLHARLGPARDIIRRLVYAAAEREGGCSILLHIFSHGGCNTAIQLALSLRNDPGHPPLELGAHLRGIIFDCCPGGPSFSRAYQAAALSLPRSPPLARTAGKTLLFPAIGLITVLQQTGWMSSVQQLRAQLNNPTIFGTTARRLYLYSTADQMVGWEDVESHQAEARARLECAIDGVAFPDSPHCALVRDHAARYWKAIERNWDGEEAFTPATATSASRSIRAESYKNPPIRMSKVI